MKSKKEIENFVSDVEKKTVNGHTFNYSNCSDCPEFPKSSIFTAVSITGKNINLDSAFEVIKNQVRGIK